MRYQGLDGELLAHSCKMASAYEPTSPIPIELRGRKVKQNFSSFSSFFLSQGRLEIHTVLPQLSPWPSEPPASSDNGGKV